MHFKVWITVIAAAALASACTSAPANKPQDLAAAYSADAKTMCELVPTSYAFYADRAAHWAEACDQAQVEAASVTTREQGVAVLEHFVDALWDNHASLGVNTAMSPWLVPSGSDMWLELRGAAVVLMGVRHGGAADGAGIRVGDVVMSIDGVMPIEAALKRVRTGKSDVSPARMAWALTAAGVGYRGQRRTLVLLRNNEKLEVSLGDPPPVQPNEPISARMIGGVGYIRFNDSLGDDETVAAFDKAVEGMRDAKGWIIDLRNTASGGSTDVAEPIMGRFMTQTAGYQVTRPLNAPAEIGQVKPRGPWTLTGPVAVLAGRWTGSMGEGMAIGFDGMKRGVVVGGAMGGLAGGVDGFTLPATNTKLRLPTYALTHVDGTPREDWMPKVLFQPDPGGADDPALARALQLVGAPS